jgi:hypothetical protein
MLRLLTPEVVAEAARTQIQTGERICLNWDLEKLDFPGTGISFLLLILISFSIFISLHFSPTKKGFDAFLLSTIYTSYYIKNIC